MSKETEPKPAKKLTTPIETADRLFGPEPPGNWHPKSATELVGERLAASMRRLKQGEPKSSDTS